MRLLVSEPHERRRMDRWFAIREQGIRWLGRRDQIVVSQERELALEHTDDVEDPITDSQPVFVMRQTGPR